MIKNIVFDIGGVLADFDPPKVMRNMGMAEEDINIVMKNSVLGPYWVELDRGALPREEVFVQMLNNIPERLHQDALRFFTTEIRNAVVPFEYSKGLLKDLKQKGYKIYLLTNYPDWLFDIHWNCGFDFKDSVDGALVSGRVKLIKPDEAIYKCLLETFSIKPEESVFLDDRKENVEGAKKCGINAIHFTSYEQAMTELNQLLN